MAAVVIRIGRRRTCAASSIASRLVRPRARLQLVGELHHQDAVLGDQPHKRDQPDLRVDVQRRQAEIEEVMAPNMESGTDIMMMNGSRKLSNCAASTR